MVWSNLMSWFIINMFCFIGSCLIKLLVNISDPDQSASFKRVWSGLHCLREIVEWVFTTNTEKYQKVLGFSCTLRIRSRKIYNLFSMLLLSSIMFEPCDRERGSSGMCKQPKFRSVCTSMQPDQTFSVCIDKLLSNDFNKSIPYHSAFSQRCLSVCRSVQL